MPTYYQLSTISIDNIDVRLRTDGKEIYYGVHGVRTLTGAELTNVKITRCEMTNKEAFLGIAMAEIIKCCQDELKDSPQYKLCNTLCNTLELLAERNFKTWLSEQQAIREKAIADGAVVVKEVGSVPEFGIIVYMEENLPSRTYYDLDKKLFAYNGNVLCVTMPKMISVVTDQCVINVCDNMDFHVSVQNSILTKTRINEINTTVANAVNEIMRKNGSTEVIVIGDINPYRMWAMHRVPKILETRLNNGDISNDKLASSEAMYAPLNASQDVITAQDVVLNSNDLVGVIKTLLKRVEQLEKVIESARVALSDDV